MSLSEAMVMVISRHEDEPALATAESLDKIGAHISVMEFYWPPESVPVWAVASDGYVCAEPILARKTASAKRELSEPVKLRRRLECFAHRVPIKRVEVQNGARADLAGIEARGASLSIMMRPSGLSNESFRRALFESVLYESGRPVLLVPPQRRTKTVGRTVLVAWDGSREATRALADAEPILAKAEAVFLFSVETDTRPCFPGSEVAAHLRRNGVRCQQRSISGERHEVEDLLLGECMAVDADMIVMGGYGHARLHEMIFGGVTRSLIRRAPVLLFISR